MKVDLKSSLSSTAWMTSCSGDILAQKPVARPGPCSSSMPRITRPSHAGESPWPGYGAKLCGLHSGYHIHGNRTVRREVVTYQADDLLMEIKEKLY